MLEPLRRRIASLITENFRLRGNRFAIGNNHSAFARCHLLIRVKSENSATAETADTLIFIFRADCLTRILDNFQVITNGDFDNFAHRRRTTENVNDHYRLRFRRNRGFDFFRVNIERLFVNVNENRNHLFIQQNIG